MSDLDRWADLWARLIVSLPDAGGTMEDIAARCAAAGRSVGTSTVSRVLTGGRGFTVATALHVLRACGADAAQLFAAAVLLGGDWRPGAAAPRQVAPGARVRVAEPADWPDLGVSVERPAAGSLGRAVLVEPDAHPPRALVLLDRALEVDLDPERDGMPLLLHWLPLTGLEVVT